MNVKTFYAFVYYSIYRAVQDQGRDGFEHWKAALLLGGAWVFLILDIILLVGIFVPGVGLQPLKGIGSIVFGALVWSLVYFPLLAESRWRRYTPEFDAFPISLSRTLRTCVLLALVLLPVAFFAISYQMKR